MKKKVIIVCLLLIILFIMTLISIDTFDIEENKYEIALNNNPECKWEHKIENADIVTYHEKYESENETINYVFIGNKEGVTKILFSCVYKDQPLIEEKEFTLKVDRNKRVVLKEK